MSVDVTFLLRSSRPPLKHILLIEEPSTEVKGRSLGVDGGVGRSIEIRRQEEANVTSISIGKKYKNKKRLENL